jgi:hypothetical protein
MTPIPPKLRKEMSEDPWYRQCCRCGSLTRIEWHHVIIFAGRQLQEKWAIVPTCEECHRLVNTVQEVKDYFLWVALNRATDKEMFFISKVISYSRMRELLNKKYAKER